MSLVLIVTALDTYVNQMHLCPSELQYIFIACILGVSWVYCVIGFFVAKKRSDGRLKRLHAVLVFFSFEFVQHECGIHELATRGKNYEVVPMTESLV